jgi:hypothetical protein
MTPSPSAHARIDDHGGVGTSLRRGAYGTIIAIGLGLLLQGTGWAIADFDDHRRHIPGHLVYRSLVVLPGLIQLAYLVPLYRRAHRRQETPFARGLVFGGALIAALNAAFVLLVWTSARMD